MMPAATRARVSLVLVAAMGCAQTETYEPIPVGPRAKLTFTSPYLEDRFLAFDELRLEISEADATCHFRTLGRISLSSGTKSAATYVVANRTVYFRLLQGNSGVFGASHESSDFSFVPEEGGEYRVEHIDNPARLRFELFKVGSDGGAQSLDLQNPPCKLP